ncbi:MAG: hypothetical protein Ct9H300mP15_12030 [Gemmatimonadota bacterium]|nr:MAG: hypothetical protein Ct9H300mP15_12030 [Gemmatimonadota bacterium]
MATQGWRLTEDDFELGVSEGDEFTLELYEQLYAEEFEKLLTAVDRDVYDYSKTTTLPIAGAIVDAYVKSEIKPPWYIDLLNINLDNADFESLAKGSECTCKRLLRTERGSPKPGFRLVGLSVRAAISLALNSRFRLPPTEKFAEFFLAVLHLFRSIHKYARRGDLIVEPVSLSIGQRSQYPFQSRFGQTGFPV